MGTRDDVAKDVCAYCKQAFSQSLAKTVDHIVAISKGGKNIQLNRVPACRKCNTTKNHHSLSEFKIIILNNPKINNTEKKRRLRAITEIIELCNTKPFDVVDPLWKEGMKSERAKKKQVKIGNKTIKKMIEFDQKIKEL